MQNSERYELKVMPLFVFGCLSNRFVEWIESNPFALHVLA